MTFNAAQLVGGVYSPTTPLPGGLAEVLASPLGYTYVTEEDYYSPTPPVLPGNYITNVFSGYVVPLDSSFGVHYGKYPPYRPGVGVPSHKVVRIHDFTHGSNSWRWSWAKIEAVQGTYDWAFLDNYVNYHYSAGSTITITLWGTPTWASARPAEVGAYGIGWLGASAEPSNLANFSTWCSVLATRYAGKIKYYEVSNEANSTAFFSGTQTILSQMTRLANLAIKAADPAAQIVASPITSLQSGGSGYAYFLSMLQASDGNGGTMKDWVDAVGIHMYPSGSKFHDMPAMISGIRAHMATLGISSKPLLNTEFSRISPDFGTLTPKQREDSLRAMMTVTSAHNAGAPSFNCWYGLDGSTFGWSISDIAVWEDHREILRKGITVINVLKDGRVAAVIGDRRFLWG